MFIEEIKTQSFRTLLDAFLLFLKEEKSYSDATITNYRCTLANIDSYLCTKGINEYSVSVGEDYYQKYIIGKERNSQRCKAVRTMIKRLNAYTLGEPYSVQNKQSKVYTLSGEFENVIQLFLNECNAKNKAITLHFKEHCLKSFFERCCAQECYEIASLSPNIIIDSCLAVNNKDDWNVIRAFLIYLCQNGFTDVDFSTLVPHYRRPIPTPTVYSIDEISRIERIPNRDTAIGKRDYAILLLATRLGMRSGDIVKLRLTDIDYLNGIIRYTQEKTGEPISLPLIEDVSDALDDYINNSRPSSTEKQIFLRTHAPYVQITTSAIRFLVTACFGKAGIDYVGKKHGPHTFRSSLASSMVNDGHSYEAVRNILGHTDPDAIKHYAKIDIERLRLCALPVPPPSGKFGIFLRGGLGREI